MNLLEQTREGPKRFYLLVYDVPRTCKLGNPSWGLRRFGVRINLSAWLMPESSVALLPLAEWRTNGIDCELARFDSGDADNILRLARKGLSREVEEIKRRLGDQAAKAAASYEAFAVTLNHERLAKADHQTYWALRRAKKALSAAEEAALGFAILGDVKELLDGIRSAITAANEVLTAGRKAAVDNPGVSRPTPA